MFGHDELGDGSDDKPLSLGFMSRKMLQNINIKDFLHFLRIILYMKLVCLDADMACFNAIMHL